MVMGALLCLSLLAASQTAAQPDVSLFPGCNEPHTAVVNPLNPQNIAVAACGNVVVSTDFGITFVGLTSATTTLPGGLTPASWGNCGDDSLAFDAGGRLWWSYLLCGDYNPPDMTRDEITVVAAQVNPTNGDLVGTPIDVTPGQHSDDKQWIAADANPTSPFSNNVYIHWTRFDNNPREEAFSRCVNCAAGPAWSAPSIVATGGGEGFRHQAHIAVGPNGAVYLTYHTNTCGNDETDGDVILMRDDNGGANLAVAGNPPAGVFKTAVFGAGGAEVTCNRQPSPPTVPNAHFLMQGSAMAFVVPDPIRPGNVYVIAADDPNDLAGSGDDGNVILARSTNYGASFSVSRIDHAPSGPASLQVFPHGAIDQDGKLVVFWYDTRRQLNNTAGTVGTADDYWNLDVYATVSVDGGLTFSNDFRINDAPFDPQLGANNFGNPPDNPPTFRIGEYNGIAAANGNAYAIWTGTSGGGQGLFFDVFSMDGAFPDRFEPNDSIQPGVPTDLGAHATYSEPELTIHGDLDEDFFRVIALATGKIRVEISQNPRLADIDVQVRDRFNQVVGTSTAAADTNGTEAVTFPAVAGQNYYVRVFSQAGQFPPLGVYDLNIVNTAAPVPFSLALQPGSDTGWYPNDRVTNDTTPSIALLVDQSALAGLALSPTPDATITNDAPGYKVAVYVNSTLNGYASAGPGPGSYVYTVSGGMVQGLNFITAYVVIIDPSDDPAVGGTAHVTGNSGQSDALLVTLDTAAPAAPSAPDLLSTSDSGVSNTDNITNINAPAFEGTGEVNTRVRILANGVIVGQSLVGSDATDGVLGDGLGHWEVTVEPLADGTYTIKADVEDLAGNISPQSPAMAGGPLVIDSAAGAPQRPTLDLLSADDTGRSDSDNVTNKTTLRFRVSAEIGTTVVIKDGNTVIDTWVQLAAFDERTLILGEGPHPLSAESEDAAGNRSHQSEELFVVVDTTPPVIPAAPDLLASSDTGGIDDDNITTLQQPHFGGSGEANALARLFAGAPQVGAAVLNSSGIYEVTSSVLGDGVYQVTVKFEDLAGNLSPASPALKVTIAHDSLTLPGLTASGPAGGPVVLDLQAGTLAGYPGIAGATGKIGIVGIPAVIFNAGGQTLTVLGTGGDDLLTYTPATATGGQLQRAGVAQTFSFTGVSTLTVDAAGGSDVVTVIGTANDDNITVTADVTMVARVGVTLAVNMPNATTERLAVQSLSGQDTITVDAKDTVNAFITVDAGDPAPAPNRKGDLLNVNGVSPRAFVQNAPGGPTPGSGVATVSYTRTTNKVTRIDYSYVEKVNLSK